jgi:hypothetical protein
VSAPQEYADDPSGHRKIATLPQQLKSIPMPHIVLLGDSIFDNASYTPSPSVHRVTNVLEQFPASGAASQGIRLL